MDDILNDLINIPGIEAIPTATTEQQNDIERSQRHGISQILVTGKSCSILRLDSDILGFDFTEVQIDDLAYTGSPLVNSRILLELKLASVCKMQLSLLLTTDDRITGSVNLDDIRHVIYEIKNCFINAVNNIPSITRSNFRLSRSIKFTICQEDWDRIAEEFSNQLQTLNLGNVRALVDSYEFVFALKLENMTFEQDVEHLVLKLPHINLHKTDAVTVQVATDQRLRENFLMFNDSFLQGSCALKNIGLLSGVGNIENLKVSANEFHISSVSHASKLFTGIPRVQYGFFASPSIAMDLLTIYTSRISQVPTSLDKIRLKILFSGWITDFRDRLVMSIADKRSKDARTTLSWSIKSVKNRIMRDILREAVESAVLYQQQTKLLDGSKFSVIPASQFEFNLTSVVYRLFKTLENGSFRIREILKAKTFSIDHLKQVPAMENFVSMYIAEFLIAELFYGGPMGFPDTFPSLLRNSGNTMLLAHAWPFDNSVVKQKGSEIDVDLDKERVFPGISLEGKGSLKLLDAFSAAKNLLEVLDLEDADDDLEFQSTNVFDQLVAALVEVRLMGIPSWQSEKGTSMLQLWQLDEATEDCSVRFQSSLCVFSALKSISGESLVKELAYFVQVLDILDQEMFPKTGINSCSALASALENEMIAQKVPFVLRDQKRNKYLILLPTKNTGDDDELEQIYVKAFKRGFQREVGSTGNNVLHLIRGFTYKLQIRLREGLSFSSSLQDVMDVINILLDSETANLQKNAQFHKLETWVQEALDRDACPLFLATDRRTRVLATKRKSVPLHSRSEIVACNQHAETSYHSREETELIQGHLVTVVDGASRTSPHKNKELLAQPTTSKSIPTSSSAKGNETLKTNAFTMRKVLGNRKEKQPYNPDVPRSASSSDLASIERSVAQGPEPSTSEASQSVFSVGIHRRVTRKRDNRPTKTSFKLPSTRNNAYKMEETKKIFNFIRDHNLYSYMKSEPLYRLIAALEIIPKRTMFSLRSHIRSVLQNKVKLASIVGENECNVLTQHRTNKTLNLSEVVEKFNMSVKDVYSKTQK